MPRKKKNALPSGSVRVQRRYIGDDGRPHTRSFTAPTKTEAEAMATEWEIQRGKLTERLTVTSAVTRYIDLKEGVLSPATVRGYRASCRAHVDGSHLGDTDLLAVQIADIQLWVSDLAAKVSPKTVRNAYGLVAASITMFMPDFPVRATLPQKQPSRLYTPSEADVRAVVDAATDPRLKVAIMLAAVGTMRRGEICALTRADIHGTTVSVTKAMVKDSSNTWIIKPPKTITSNRDIPMPESVVNALLSLPDGKDGRIIGYNPTKLTQAFERAIRRSGVHPFRFHDLRHFSASQMHAQGIPDKYIEARGGWRPGSTVMKNVYQDVIDLERKRQDKRILEAFGAINIGKCD